MHVVGVWEEVPGGNSRRHRENSTLYTERPEVESDLRHLCCEATVLAAALRCHLILP